VTPWFTELSRRLRHEGIVEGLARLLFAGENRAFGTRLAEAGCDAFTIAQLLGHSDVRVTMRYVRMVEGSKRVAVEAMKLTSKSWSRIGHLAKTATVPCGCKWLKIIGGAEGDRTPDLRIAGAEARYLRGDEVLSPARKKRSHIGHLDKTAIGPARLNI
jgi:hypothetical protein